MLTTAKNYIYDLNSPSLEFGCMDGLNSFLLWDGELHEKYDVFSETLSQKNSHLKANLENDYYDTYNSSINLPITSRPNLTIDIAVDWKESHLRKASRLNLYKKFELMNLAAPSLQAPNSSLNTVWAPNLYWVPSISSILGEVGRVLSRQGRLFTILPDRSQLNHMSFKYANIAPESWLKMIDRGRYENVSNNARTLDQWNALFIEHKFKIERHKGFIPDIVARTYDIGFRPMFSVLLDIYKKLDAKSNTELISWKRYWINEITSLLAPLVDTDWYEKPDTAYDWHFFELRNFNN